MAQNEPTLQNQASINNLDPSTMVKSIFSNLTLDQLFWDIPRVCSGWQYLTPFPLESHESLFLFDLATFSSLAHLYDRYGIVFASEKQTILINDTDRAITPNLINQIVELFPNLKYLSVSLSNDQPVLQFLDQLLSALPERQLLSLNVNLANSQRPAMEDYFSTNFRQHLYTFWRAFLEKLNSSPTFANLRRLTLSDVTPFFFLDSGVIPLGNLTELEELNFGVPIENRRCILEQLEALPKLLKFSILTTIDVEDEELLDQLDQYLPNNRLVSLTFPFESERHSNHVRHIVASSTDTLQSLQINARHWRWNQMMPQLARLKALTHLKIAISSPFLTDELPADFFEGIANSPDTPQILTLRKLSLSTPMNRIHCLSLDYRHNYARAISKLFPALEMVEFADLGIMPSDDEPDLMPFPECLDMPYFEGEERPNASEMGIFSDFDGTGNADLEARYAEFRKEEINANLDEEEGEADEELNSDEEEETEGWPIWALEPVEQDDEDEDDDEDYVPRSIKTFSRSKANFTRAKPKFRTIQKKVCFEEEIVAEADSSTYLAKFKNTHATLKKAEHCEEESLLQQVAFSVDLFLSTSSIFSTLTYLHIDFLTGLSAVDLFAKLSKLSALLYLRMCCSRNYFAKFPQDHSLAALPALISLHLDVLIDHSMAAHILVPCYQLHRVAPLLPKLMNLKFDRLIAPRHDLFAVSSTDLAWFRSLPLHFLNLRKIWLLKECGDGAKLPIGLCHRTCEEEHYNRLLYRLTYLLHCKDIDHGEDEPLMVIQRVATALTAGSD